MSIAELLQGNGFEKIFGVPDSVLSPLLSEIEQLKAISQQVVACEGSAVCLAAGYSISSGHPACAYMQNSGLPNAINPLASLLSADVLSTPILLLIGWRGRPGTNDEPQHQLIGRQTIELLKLFGIESFIVDKHYVTSEVDEFIKGFLFKRRPMALLFDPSWSTKKSENHPLAENMTAEYPCVPRTLALDTILKSIDPDSIVVGGIGHISREILHYIENNNYSSLNLLPCVGGMGFASHLAIGISSANPEQRVYCIDGDGSFLMHGTGNAIVRSLTGNFTHVVLNNGCHNSVGGWPTVDTEVSLADLGRLLGYEMTSQVFTIDELHGALRDASNTHRTAMIEVHCDNSRINALPRPSLPVSNFKDEIFKVVNT